MSQIQQLQIDFSTLHHNENTVENQLHFEANKEKFSKQCKIVFEALMRGERLTTAKALIEYGIGDLRRRVKDLIDMWGVPVQSKYIKGNYKKVILKQWSVRVHDHEKQLVKQFLKELRCKTTTT